MTKLTNKTILVTGATGGFGQEFTKQLFSKGNQLILADLDSEKLQSFTEEVNSENGAGQIIANLACDLSSGDGANQLFEQAQALDIPIDVLINNAGIGLLGRHDEVPQAAWERLMEINLMAPMRLCALFSPQMIQRGSGHIINIASLAAWSSDIGLSAYSASKFGLRGFSEAQVNELGKYGVQISAVYPYYSRTPIINSPRYGTLAHENPADQVNPQGMTEPADVVAEVIAGVEQNKVHIFPDKTARFIYRLQRYAPKLLEIIRSRYSKTSG